MFSTTYMHDHAWKRSTTNTSQMLNISNTHRQSQLSLQVEIVPEFNNQIFWKCLSETVSQLI
jgi:hypothetical protein